LYVFATTYSNDQDATVFLSLEDCLNHYQNHPNNFTRIFVIGGSTVYKEAMEKGLCDRIFFTRVDASSDIESSCDAHFPPIPESLYQSATDTEIQEELAGLCPQLETIKENGISYKFMLFKRKS
jgi:dihydrofolate reductase